MFQVPRGLSLAECAEMWTSFAGLARLVLHQTVVYQATAPHRQDSMTLYEYYHGASKFAEPDFARLPC